MKQFSKGNATPPNTGSLDSAREASGGCKPSLKGIRVLLITSGHEATDARIYSKQACSLQKMGAHVKVVGSLQRRAPMPVQVLSVPPIGSRLMRFLWQPWRCLWRARNEKPDIIHFHDAEMLATLLPARMRWPRCKFVYDVHEDFANLMMIRDWLPGWMKPAVRFVTDKIEKRLALRADAIVGVTPPLTAKFPNKNRIVAYNFVSAEFFKKTYRELRRPRLREFEIAHVGTLSMKRAAFLAETLAAFHALRPSARSVVIGLAPEMEAFLKTRVPANCLLLGKTSHEEIPRLLGNSMIGLDVHPWLQAHLKVALPVKVCEYMAAGCAVVSSSMPVLKELVDELGIRKDALTLIPEGTPADYAKAAADIVQSIDSGSDPGAELCEIASQSMHWDREAEKIGRLYRTLVDY